MKLRNTIFFLVALVLAAQILIEPRIVSETLPSGGLMQIKLDLTSPHPITTGGASFDMDSSFERVEGVSMLSPGGDAYGVAVVQGQRFSASLISPQASLGTQLDYPFLMVAAKIRAGLAAGTKVPINFGAATSFQGPGGIVYSFPAAKNGVLTIGGSVSVTNIAPGGGLLPAGTTVRILGTGFSAQTRVDVTDAAVTNVHYVSPTEIDFTMGATKDMTGTRFRVRNQDNSEAVYYSYLRTVSVGASSRQVLNDSHALFPNQTITSGGLTIPVAPANGFIGLALRNSSLTQANVDLDLVSSGGAALGHSSIGLPGGSHFLRTIPELFGSSPPDANIRISSSAAIQAMGLRGDDTAGTVTAFLTGAPPVVVAAQLQLTPVTLSFDAVVGGAAPTAKNVSVASTGAPLTYTAVASAAWLNVSPGSGQTPANLSVSVNPAGLGVGSYTGTITVTAAGANPQTVNVTLNVAAAPVASQITLAPAALTFDLVVGAVASSKTINVSSTGAALAFSSTSTVAWLTAAASATQTPALLTVTANPAGLAAGSYAGTITVTAAGANPQTVNVTLNVSVVPLASQISLTPAALTYDLVVGAAASSKTINVSSTGVALAFSSTSNATWLTAAASSTLTPAVLTVTANPAGLGVGNYTGTITVNGAGATPQTLSVTLNLTALPRLSISPSALIFDFTIGGAAPSVRTASVTSTGGTLSFTAASNASWFSVTPLAGQTPGFVTVSANPTGLATGTYTGSVTLSSPGAAVQSVLVTLNISSTPAVTEVRITPASLAFAYTVGGIVPATQTAQLDSGAQSTAFTLTSSAGWFSATASKSTTPATVNVNVNASGLPQGTYTGTITVSPATGTPQILTVFLQVNGTAVVLPQVTAVVNGASQSAATALAPGEIITIYGSGLGPVNGQGGILSSPDRIDSIAGGTRVWFGVIPAPILYTFTGQVNTIVPYEASGSTPLQVEFDGRRSLPRDVLVVSAAPALFTQNASGKGRAAVLNQDYSLNTPQQRAARGSVIMIYATGGGQTLPASTTGQIAGSELLVLVAPVTVTIGGRNLGVLFAGAAPGLVTGLMQLNVLIPADFPVGESVPISISVGGFVSPVGTTISIE